MKKVFCFGELLPDPCDNVMLSIRKPEVLAPTIVISILSKLEFENVKSEHKQVNLFSGKECSCHLLVTELCLMKTLITRSITGS